MEAENTKPRACKSTPDSDNWDDCVVLPNTSPFNSLTGFHVDNDTTVVYATKKPKLDFNLRKQLTDAPVRRWWSDNSAIANDHAEIITDPFKICIIKDLIDSPDLLTKLRNELSDLDFNLRSIDLYEFMQSEDLKFITTEYVQMVYRFLQNDVMKWVADVTGYDLTSISCTCSLYCNTDYLLVHDDQREDRRVAFILYLTDENGWDISNGGLLDLFSKDNNGHPNDVIRSIVPANNQFVFFPVTNDSYHQVSEVTSLEKYRLSINGWFHTKIPPVYDIPVYQPLENSLYSDKGTPSKEVDISLASWICDDYLVPTTIRSIQKRIEDSSELSLSEFFKPESLEEVVKQLQSTEILWTKVVPVNRYSYEIADTTTLPYVLERLLDLFQSEQMFELLELYTDLELAYKKGTMKLELQKWTPGSYALLTEYDWKAQNELDLIMYFGCEAKSVIGARTHYVSVEDEIQNALVTIEPEQNVLNIVYRDAARFTKYFSKQSKCKCFYSLVCSYSEKSNHERS